MPGGYRAVRGRILTDSGQAPPPNLPAEGGVFRFPRLYGVLLVRVGQEQAVPFEVRVPNPETIKAIEAGRRGEVARFKSVKGLMEDLNADD